jgi:hypothetical protein
MKTEQPIAARLVSARALCGLFNPPVSERHIRDLKAEGTIPFVQVGGRVFFDPDRVMQALVDHTVQAGGAQ